MNGENLLELFIQNGKFYSEPYPLFARLRDEYPVLKSDLLGGWVVSRYEEVAEVLHNHEDFSSKGRVLHLLNQLDNETKNQLPLLQMHFSTGLAHSDAPEHRRLRGLLAQAFTPKMVEKMRPIISNIVSESIEHLHDESDLIADVFTPVPARVVGRLLGSKDEDIPNLIRWADSINGLYEKGGRIAEDKALLAEKLLREMREFVLSLTDDRRKLRENGNLDPSVDILSGLVACESQDDALTESELISTAVTLFVAGHETTTHLLGNGFLALIGRTDVFEILKSHPELISGAVDEMARFDGSVPRSWRIAKRDISLGGIKIPKGDLVLPLLASANRDGKIFDDPEKFDIRRDNRKHLAFGRGVHVCLGAPLAKLEAQEIVFQLLNKFKTIELAIPYDELVWRRDVALRGLMKLPVCMSS